MSKLKSSKINHSANTIVVYRKLFAKYMYLTCMYIAENETEIVFSIIFKEIKEYILKNLVFWVYY